MDMSVSKSTSGMASWPRRLKITPVTTGMTTSGIIVANTTPSASTVDVIIFKPVRSYWYRVDSL